MTAQLPATSYIRRVLPHQLRKVSRVMVKPRVSKVILLALIAPSLDTGGHIRVADGEVLAVWAPGVLKGTVVVIVEIVRRESGQRLVPGDIAGVVLPPVEVGAVQDGGGEGVLVVK